MSSINALNEAQRKAVQHTEGPLLIIAGAGAGKTRVITHRIAKLIERGTPPERIMAVTFTNKAAREMRERAETMLSDNEMFRRASTAGLKPYIATFHALGASVLREHARKAGIKRRFTIYDRSDSLQVLKEAMREIGIDPKQVSPRSLLSLISRYKGDNHSLADARGAHESDAFVGDVRIIAAWERYEARLARSNALDFDDLILRATQLLTRHPDILRAYHDRYRYLHIDEYQDTNRAQYELMRLLAGKRANVCVVGDIDQTIYSWRGATLDNLLQFERAYPNASVVFLEQNYRSTKTILDASNAVIRKNKRRFEKNLFTENGAGEKLSLSLLSDESGEAFFVAQRSRELVEKGVPPQEIAVLYRANFQSRALEEAFLSLEVPYQVLGTRFFERKEVKDVLSFLRAAQSAESVADITRVVNVPPRGIGKVTLLKMLEGREEEMIPALRAKVRDFKELLARIKDKMARAVPSAATRFIIVESGLEERLGSGSEDDLERLENLRELVTLAARYDSLPPEEGIEKLLEDAALATEQDELKDERSAVRLMTVHAAKGLEFDHVFITGLEEGLFPHAAQETSRKDEERDEEEERRLFYVALTRARKKVFLTWASFRTLYGTREVTTPSQFIMDIDPALVETEGYTAETPERVIYLE